MSGLEKRKNKMVELNATSTLTISDVAGSWGGTVLYIFLFVFLPIGGLIILITVLWNIANYTRFKKYLGVLGNSLRYAMIGAVSILVISIPFAFLYWGYSQARKGNIVPLKYTGYILLGYIALAIIGWLVEKYVINRVVTFEKMIDKQEKKKPKEKEKEKDKQNAIVGVGY